MATAAAALAIALPARGQTYEINGRPYEVARDQLEHVPGKADSAKNVKVAPKGNLKAILKTASDLELATGERHEIVLYALNAPRTLQSKRVLQRSITIRPAPGGDPAVIAAAVQAGGQKAPAYAPGFRILTFDTPEATLTALEALRKRGDIELAEPLVSRWHTKRFTPNDSLYPNQWHLNNTGQGTGTAGIDANITTVWDTYKGTGIRIGIVDDGLEVAHPDLSPNADTVNDHDWNDATPDDPTPGNTVDDHGTACAGVAAGKGNNTIGISGAAPEATLVGLRLTAAAVSDADEAEAMNWRSDIIQVKSNSWGPGGTGTGLDPAGPLTKAALQNTAETGRGGLGTIHLWAAGNGFSNDNVNRDGYANSIYTIAIGAVNDQGLRSDYSEPGSAKVVSAPSNNSAAGYQGITTTDLVANGSYRSNFGGTSSATPLAAGVTALMLEANPNLGWRDVQEILISTAVKVQPTDPGWADNGTGQHFSHDFGAGMIDAQSAVNAALTWTNLGPHGNELLTDATVTAIPDNTPAGITRTFDFSTLPELRVEHAVVTVDIDHTYRGDIKITLVSPDGTESVMMANNGDGNANIPDWSMLSVFHWGESSDGTWTVRVSDNADVDTGTLNSVSLQLFGSSGPANDDFAMAEVLAGSSGTVTGTNFRADKEPGEPAHTGNSGGASVWYEWTAPVSGLATVDTLTSTFDTMLTTYTGGVVNSLTPVPGGSNDDAVPGSVFQSTVSFPVTGGTVYRIAVDGYDGVTGDITLHYTILPPPVINSALAAAGTEGGAFNYQITGTNTPTSYNASGLPSGLGIDTGTGIISGTPTVNGTFNVTISATNAGGTGNETLVLTVNPTLADSLDAPALVWTSSGNADWFGQAAVTHDTIDAGRSGAITDNQTSSAETSVTGPGTLSFWWKVSSEASWDFLRFYVDGGQVPEAPGISGEVDWQQRTVPVPAGVHTLRWTFSKDSVDLDPVGLDAGFLDEVVFISSQVANANGAGPGSLRQTIADLPGGETITFDPGLNNGTIALGGSGLLLDKDFTLDASALPDGLTIDGGGLSRVFEITAGSTVVMHKFTITGGNAFDGGAIHNLGDLTAQQSTVSGNVSTNQGGGIFNGGSLQVSDSTIVDNTATNNGGGIHNAGVGAVATVTNTTFFNNTSNNGGGGAFNNTVDAIAELVHVTITGNTALGAGIGGGIRRFNGTVTIENSIVAGNSAASDDDLAGGVTQIGPNLTFTDPQLAALGDYGGCTETMPPLPGSPALHSAVVTSTTPATDQREVARAQGPGNDLGAVELEVRTVLNGNDSGPDSLRQAILDAGQVALIDFDGGLDGGAVTLSTAQLLLDKNLGIDASALPNGITIDADSPAGTRRVFEVAAGKTVTMRNLAVTGGNTSSLGGGINNSGSLVLTDCAVAGNVAGSGGGIFNSTSSGGNVTMINGTISGNIATGFGGGISSMGGGPPDDLNGTELRNVTVSGNLVNPSGSGQCFAGGIHLQWSFMKLINVTVTDNTINDTGASGGGGGILRGSGGNLHVENSIVAGNHTTTSLSVDLQGTVATRAGVNFIGDPTGASGIGSLGTDYLSGDAKLIPLGDYGGLWDLHLPLPSSPAIDAGLATADTPAADQRGVARPQSAGIDIGAAEVEVLTVLNTDDSGPGSLRQTVADATAVAFIDFVAGLDNGTISVAGTQILLDKNLHIDASSLPSGITLDGTTQTRVFEVAAGQEVILDSLHLTRGNSDTDGGGLLNNGTLTMRNCTVSKSAAGNSGGGLANPGALTLINSTLSGNFALFDSGGLENGGTATLRHSTVSDNEAFFGSGGGIYNDGTMTLENSIVAGNIADFQPDLSGSSVAELGNNLLSGDPALAPLADYGGPAPTMPPLPGSVVIEAAVLLGTTPATDQLGNARPSGPLPDLGAIEAVAFGSLMLADSEPDGIPDVLEPAYGQFTVGVDDSGLDSDGDRMTDAEELLNMTDPLDPNDLFKILVFALAPGYDAQNNPLVSVTISTFPGLLYELTTGETLDNMQVIPDSSFTATDYTTSFEILLGTGSERTFLRAQLK